jgi:hypothetical protein
MGKGQAYLFLGPLIVLVATVVVMTLALQLSFKIVTGSTIEFRDALIINIVAGVVIFAAGFITSGMELTEGVRSAVEFGLNFVIFTVLIAWMLSDLWRSRPSWPWLDLWSR